MYLESFINQAVLREISFCGIHGKLFLTKILNLLTVNFPKYKDSQEMLPNDRG